MLFDLRIRPFVLSLAAIAALAAWAQSRPVELDAKISAPFRFVAYGDARFTDPTDTVAANPTVRRTLVQAIADARPAFISFGGDITYNGNDPADWKVYDSETAIWRQRKITVYPALGNHELHGDLSVALANYFERFPDLHHNTYYAVRAGNTLLLALDSSVPEVSGPQGDWLKTHVEDLAPGVDFLFVVLHHPPYTSSSDESKNTTGGGHSARPAEQDLAVYLEQQQRKLRARIVVFSGHVHNYERHEHGGVLYFVSGGAGAHAYPIPRDAGDPFQSDQVNYHYILVEVEQGRLKATMNRVEMVDGVAKWTQPDSVTVQVPAHL